MTARKMLFSGFSFWVALALFSLYFVMPIRERLNFGIDLVGGTYITLEVQTEKAVEATLASHMRSLADHLRSENKPTPTESAVENGEIVLKFDSVGAANEASMALRNVAQELTVSAQGNNLFFSLSAQVIDNIKRESVLSDIEILRTRLDPFSTSEITIAAQGEKNIVVELPNVDDPQQAKAMIGKSAVLEFKLVDRVGSSKEDILYAYDGSLPNHLQILPGKSKNEFYAVTRDATVTGDQLKDAQAGLGGAASSEIVVLFQFNTEGDSKFYDLTRNNIGKPLAIVLDDVVITAPNITEPIRGGGSIRGGYTVPKQAQELAMLLKSGAFAAPVTFQEERQVGPSLGEESIRKGLLSCLVGLGLLFIFSIFYYSLSGFFAFVALVYNLLLVLIAMSWLGATLTLPGIAGLVLTVGMAIDASILIYEHIKECLAEGMAVKAAVDAGFSNAMVVILDANITTFIVGAMLYYFGTGPIQGFAVTMMIGIIATLITGLFFLRSIFSLLLTNFSIKKLRI